MDLNALLTIDWTDANLQWVLTGTTLLGVAASVLGCFAFLRGRSLMGDALAHAALPGVCLAFMFGAWLRSRNVPVEPKSLLLLLVGAGMTGIIAAWCVQAVTRHSRIKEDAAQAIVLSVFFGAGIVLLTRIQHSDLGEQSGLDKFLFGQAASLVIGDVRLMAGVAVVLCIMVTVVWKELKVLCFDRAFGQAAGLPITQLDGLLMLMIVAAVVIGLQAVGVVLIAALLITPPAAARFWTDKLGLMIPLAALFGGLSGALGTLVSTMAPRLPTGPLIVLSATFFFVISVLFAPQRGAVARLWRVLSTQRKVREENLLRDLFELAEREVPATQNELLQKRHGSAAILKNSLRDLTRRGLVQADQSTLTWQLTKTGLREAYDIVHKHRLWETFLMYETSLGAHRVHRDADTVEHFLPPEVLDQLEMMMRQNGWEPRLKPLD
jgi:manganese/zinc/iron transport system permease protein